MKINSNLQRYGLAIIACSLAFLLSWLTGATTSCLVLAIIVSSLYGGRGPGFLAVGLAVLAFNGLLFWLPSFPLATAASHGLRFGVFIGVALLINALIAAKRRSDEALRQSAEDYRIVAEAATDAILSIDESNQIVFANDAATRIFGWSVEDLMGRSLSTVMTESPGNGHSRVAEVVALRSDGTEFPAEISFVEVLRKGRRSFTGFVRDISELKQSQAILRKSESYLAEAQKLSHTGSFGVNVATGDVFWSEESYRIAGLESGTKPTREWVINLVHPEDRHRLQQILHDAIKDGGNLDFEHRLLMPDGSLKYLHVVAHALTNELNQIEYLGAVTDISAIRRAEEELRRSEEKYRELVQLSPDAIYVVDAAGLLISTNPAGLKMLRCTAEEAAELNIAETHLPEDRPAYTQRLQQLQIGRSFQFERTFLRRDGTTLPVDVSVSPIRNGLSQAVLRDVSERKQAQEALRRSEFYLSEAEKLSHSGSWAFDVVQGKMIYWSAENCRLEHHDPSLPLPSPEEGQRKYPPEDWALLVREVERSIRDHRDFDCELRRFAPDGSMQHIRVVAHPLLSAAGEVVEIIGTCVDITEQWEAKAALKEAFDKIQRSEDQLRLIIDTIPALAWSTAADGSLEFVNQRWREYAGLSIEQVHGWGWKIAIHPDDLEQLVAAWSAAIACGAPSESEARLRRFDGAYRWFLFRTVPLRDSDGQITKWYGTNTDIEDRKLAEEALRESERSLRLIVDTIPALVWCALPDGKLESVNQRIVDYLGVPVSDLVEHGWADFLHPDDVEPTLRSWFHAVANETRHEVEYRMRCADGAYRWFHVLGQPLLNEEGRIVRWYGLLSDIEDRKHAMEMLRQTQARLSQAMQIATIAEFAASIAHEVNQPLAAVMANGHACHRWLSLQPPNLAEANLSVSRIVRDSNAAADVVQRIRALFKQAEPEVVPLDLNDVVAEVVRLLQAETVRQGVLVETELEDSLPPVMADRLQLQQVLFNLLQNGMEAMDTLMEQPKRLLIRSKRQTHETVLVEIRDYGSGLDDLDKPFESFYTTKASGMGMGLAICRSIIDAHHGCLWAAPTEGRGATFCLTLPLQTGTLQATTSPNSAHLLERE
jgi:PAS domain S-box-containing protein